MKYIFFALFSLLLMSAMNVSAWKIEATYTEGEYSIYLSDILYPEAMLSQELDSGLPNNISVIFRLSNKKTILLLDVITYRVIYDLWEETYSFSTIRGLPGKGKMTRSEIFDRKALLMETLKKVEIKNLPLPDDSNQFNWVEAQAYINPINKKKIDKIQKWLSHNLGSSSSRARTNFVFGQNFDSAPSSIRAGERSRGPRFKKLFEQILEQYTSSDSLSAQWRGEVMRLDIHTEKEK